jgi:hypothetical protein
MSGNGTSGERPGATADNLRAEAARYHAEAAEIETGVKTPVIKAAPEQD